MGITAIGPSRHAAAPKNLVAVGPYSGHSRTCGRLDLVANGHRGRIVKTTGDGVLVEFASTVDAVRCAIDIQRAMPARSADMPPEKKIEFRAASPGRAGRAPSAAT
jgi:hypothetical protein